MASAAIKAGKVLGDRVFGVQADPYGTDDFRHADPSIAAQANVEPFDEADPTVGEWVNSVTPTPRDVGRYFYNLFPFLHWIPRYNLTWLAGDLIAGTTVGAVVVPQGMAYAKLALLPVEYGLYSSFMGVLIYWFFATSKDITIGPVAVMSTVTGTVVAKAQESIPDVPGHLVASALALICGGIVAFLGLARLGWLVEFIPLPAICAFMTGSAINIAAGQVPTLMGISKRFSTRDAPYLVIINTLKNLHYSTVDAAMGLTALLMLYIIKFGCRYYAARYPHREKLFFFLSTLRTAFVILLYTAISAGVNLHRRDNPLFSIVLDVPSGFQHAEVPTLDSRIIKAFASELPASVIVILIEHISISKSFGRINNYVIDPSQELVAIGVTNLLGPFLGAYPATGSFSRTAIKSKSGVRTPFAGVITAVVVLLALYALTAVFFYIPNASLAGVIIHAVLDVITPLNTVWQMWRISPLEVVIFFAGVLVTIFTTIENGVYTTICVSFALLIFRTFKAKGHFLGVVRLRPASVDPIPNSKNTTDSSAVAPAPEKTPLYPYSSFSGAGQGRNLFLPIDHHDGFNPRVFNGHPYPGVFIYQFAESFNYPNANRYLDALTAEIFRVTRRTDPASLGKLGDRPWNNPGPRKAKALLDDTDERPTLRAVILDCSAVNNIDVTCVQALIDVRKQLDRYAAPDVVEWRFANIKNRWTRRALAVAGFGIPRVPSSPASDSDSPPQWPVQSVFSVTELLDGGDEDAKQQAAAAAVTELEGGSEGGVADDKGGVGGSGGSVPSRTIPPVRGAPVYGLNRPLFHADLQEALDATVANLGAKP